MKRSKVIEILSSWGKPEILQDIYHNNYTEWADNLLYTLENEFNLKIIGDDGYEIPYEPEGGWDKYFESQALKDEARDFEIVSKLNNINSKRVEIVKKFLEGASTEELSFEYEVTRERIRQIINKERIIYQRLSNGVDK